MGWSDGKKGGSDCFKREIRRDEKQRPIHPEREIRVKLATDIYPSFESIPINMNIGNMGDLRPHRFGFVFVSLCRWAVGYFQSLEVGRLITSNVLIEGQNNIFRVSREGRQLKSGREWRFSNRPNSRLLREVGRLVTSNVLIEGQVNMLRFSREARPLKSGREWRFFKCPKTSCLREMRLCKQAERSSRLRSSSHSMVSECCRQVRMMVPSQTVKKKLYCSWTPVEGESGYGGETLQAGPPPPTHRITTVVDLKFFE
ncbi:hypothetical protein Taro_049318 [Colocasia esculenta]|uniref:Uncharacterized protein n=1 Tax=Colocasia esculenta TaxID=4460 RepID=A0A843XAL6_COLES|nr:hypothetical protein [Colocasia esculenta]